MIFHVPFALDPNSGRASGIRPYRMRQAFEAIGYEVIEVSGRHVERRAQIKRIRDQIAEGLRVDFVYSEAATTPTGLGEPITPATSLRRDLRFLRFCQRLGIPVGLFYRDVYWRFPIYNEAVRPPLSTVLRALYRRDLRSYRDGGFRVYLPSIPMAAHIPIVDPSRFAELPPGCDVRNPEPLRADSRSRTTILYVGGFGSNYRMHDTVRAIAARTDVELVICTREAEWRKHEAEYRDFLAPNIRIVHASGDDLESLYAEADICLLAVEPVDYWKFAVPLKMFEYLGHGKPMIASAGTFAAQFVDERGIGWVVGYGSQELAELLSKLNSTPDAVSEMTTRVRDTRQEHTWAARARKVASDLTGMVSARPTH